MIVSTTRHFHDILSMAAYIEMKQQHAKPGIPSRNMTSDLYYSIYGEIYTYSIYKTGGLDLRQRFSKHEPAMLHK